MQTPLVDEVVRLGRDIPELMLYRGAIGTVCSIWFAPLAAFEVEFDVHGQPTRVLLLSQEVQLVHERAMPQRHDTLHESTPDAA